MSKPPDETSLIVFTIGHSTRTIEEFINLLKTYDIAEVVDIRTVPHSRHNPQFNRETLPSSLKTAGIEYACMTGLGGLRHAQRDSQNMGWRNASFRGFADYMQMQEFEEAMRELMKLAKEKRIALMCAEALPWRCHRSLIADALSVRGIQVEHIMSLTHRQTHKLTAFAKVDGTKITYPAHTSKLSIRPSPHDKFRSNQENNRIEHSGIYFRASVVRLILDGNVEEALRQLSKHYNVNSPRIRVGLPARHRAKVLGCYTAKDRTIHVLDSDVLKDPFVVLHEFYHHLRTSADRKHRGTEKYANQFARDFFQ